MQLMQIMEMGLRAVSWFCWIRPTTPAGLINVVSGGYCLNSEVWDLLVVMAKSNLEEDIFNGLKQRGIELNTHVENIFRFTGYNNARTRFRQFHANFNCATGVQEIEECVRSTLGEKERHVKMDSQKRTATFGEWFADDPCDFIF